MHAKKERRVGDDASEDGRVPAAFATTTHGEKKKQ